jgi:hypothetical protein
MRGDESAQTDEGEAEKRIPRIVAWTNKGTEGGQAPPLQGDQHVPLIDREINGEEVRGVRGRKGARKAPGTMQRGRPREENRRCGGQDALVLHLRVERE